MMLVMMIYPIVVLIMLTRPSIVAAFREPALPSAEEWETEAPCPTGGRNRLRTPSRAEGGTAQPPRVKKRLGFPTPPLTTRKRSWQAATATSNPSRVYCGGGSVEPSA